MRLRAFHKITDELCNVFQMLQPDTGEPIVVGWNGKAMRMDWGNWIVLRPTGVVDAAGRIVFESDSLEGSSGNNAFIGIVKWIESECSFFVEIPGGLQRLNEAFMKSNNCRVTGCSLIPVEPRVDPPEQNALPPPTPAPAPTTSAVKPPKKPSPKKHGKSHKS